VELAAGFGEGAMVGYGTEVAKMSEFHRAPLLEAYRFFRWDVPEITVKLTGRTRCLTL
jgi:hypothetical protein